MKKQTLILLMTLMLGIAGSQSILASVINYADVAGLTTFQDTNTGRVWLDMDNFFDSTATFGTTGFDMISTANGAGFTFATQADVQQLLDSLPLTGGEWAGYAAVMGYGIPRQLIWGMFDDGNGNPYGWAWAYSSDSSWNYALNATDANTVQNGGSAGSVDMGIWAYQTGEIDNHIPEPGTLVLMSLGLIGAACSAKRRPKNA